MVAAATGKTVVAFIRLVQALLRRRSPLAQMAFIFQRQPNPPTIHATDRLKSETPLLFRHKENSLMSHSDALKQ
jgi:hypothetical protein